MLVEIAAPVGALGLVADRSLPEGTTLEFEQTASVLDCGKPSLVVSGNDAEDVVRTIRERPIIGDITVIGNTDEETVFRLSWDAAVPDLLGAIRESDGSVLSATAQNDVWTFDIRFPRPDAASRFYTRYDDDSYPLTVHRMTQQGATHQHSNGQLTAEQRDALSRAVTAGYFDVPRRTTLVDLARDLDISDTAVSQRLRRGVSTVLQDAPFVSRETEEASRHDS